MKPHTVLLLVVVMMVVMPAVSAQGIGDVNANGTIDIVDALLTAQYYVGLSPQPFHPENADVNSNATVDIVDALLIAQYYVGLITVFPGATPGITIAPTPAATAILPAASKKVIGYFTSWGIYQREFFPEHVPFAKLTHINYAFANIVNGEIALGDTYADTQKLYDGDVWDQPLAGNFHQLNVKYRALFPHIRTLISVGGWTWSTNFSDVALTDATRKKFAVSCVAFIKKYSFDGVDIDWEYPDGGGLAGNVTRPEDPHNVTLLLAELKAQLDAQGRADSRTYLLTIAGSAGTSHIANLELGALAQSLDWINVMTYDFHGGWDARTGHLSNLFETPLDPGSAPLSCDAAIRAYRAAGFPAEKLMLGIPFYGRAWGGVAETQNGFGQQSTSSVSGSWGEAGYFDYSEIIIKGYPLFWDADAKVPWSYSAQDKVFISHDNPQSMGLKGEYVNANDLGGMMIWELSGDRSGILLDAIRSVMD